MSITLYEHQLSAINKLKQGLVYHQSGLLRAECGWGKTVAASYIAEGALKKGSTLWFMCHRKELIKQASRTFDSFGINHSIIMSGSSFSYKDKVFICSIDTIKYKKAKRIYTLPFPDVLIFDECHHMGAAGWQMVVSELNFLADYRSIRRPKIIGLSATPERYDGQGLGDFFDFMIETEYASWLIENGFLSDYVAYSKDPGINTVGMKFGDYDNKALAEETNKTYITQNIVEQWKSKAFNLPTICYAVNIDHSECMAQRFKSQGVSAVSIDYKTPKPEKDRAFRAFANNELKIICNKDLFGEGLDISALTGSDVRIKCVIAARKTQSRALHRQQIFRCLRKDPSGQPGIILDPAVNLLNKKLGLPDEDIEWSLRSKKRGRRGDQEKLPPKIKCAKCFGDYAPAAKCPFCGHKNEVKFRKIIEEGGELIEVDKEKLKREKRTEVYKTRGYDNLVELAEKRGYKNPKKWATMVHQSRLSKRQSS